MPGPAADAPRRSTGPLLAAMTLANGMILIDQTAADHAAGHHAHVPDRLPGGHLLPARAASEHGYSVAFLAVSVISLLGAALCWWLVRRPPVPGEEPAAECLVAPSPDVA